MPELLPWLVAAAFMVGLAKGGLTSSAALAVPFLSLVMNPVQAAALLLPIFITTDWIAVWLYRENKSLRNIAILTPAVLAGVALATVLVAFLPEPALLAFTASIGIWAATRSWLGRTRDAPPKPAAVAPGVFWGVVCGVSTFITHSGAPPIQAYLLPQRLPRLVFAGTIAIVFAISNMAKLPGYYALGHFNELNWLLVGSLIAVGIAGTMSGRIFVRYLSDVGYTRFIEVALLLLSLALLWKAWALATAQ